MPKKSPEIDAYIAKSAEFAQPILAKIRQLFHKACPEVEETMKWSFPHFDYKGMMLGSMAAFKQHATFGFWKQSLMKDPEGLFKKVGDTSMGMMKITSLDELPKDAVIVQYIKEAMRLNEEGIKAPRPEKKPKAAIVVPNDLKAALKKNAKAQAAFDGFSPSHKREYVEWITEAKQQATRDKRLAQAIEWMSENKPKNWKYMK